jgi:hypothetical protein
MLLARTGTARSARCRPIETSIAIAITAPEAVFTRSHHTPRSTAGASLCASEAVDHRVTTRANARASAYAISTNATR